MKSDELDVITNIETTIFNQSYTADYLETFHLNGDVLVAAVDKEIVGIIGWFSNHETAEIIMLGVIKEVRRQKIATRLLIAMLSVLKQNKTVMVFIEVRKNNEAAINFYQKNGFKINRIRKNYYQNPFDDAIEMSVNL